MRRHPLKPRPWPLVFAVLLAGCGRISVPQSPLLKYVERKSGLIAAVNEQGNLVVTDQGGATVTALTTDGRMPESSDSGGAFSYYEIPVWSPDGTRIAAAHFRGESGQVKEARIDVIPAGGGPATAVYTSTTQAPAVLGWSPDSDRLVFLASSPSGASYGFYLVSAQGGSPLLLDAGRPYGWAWSPRSKELVIHAGSVAGGLATDRLAFLDVEQDVLEEGLGLPSGVFGAPAWSTDGRKVLVAAWTGDRNRLYITNRARTEGAAIADADGQIEFALAPGDDRVAYVSRTQDGARLYVADVPTRMEGRQSEAQLSAPAAAPGKALSGDDVVVAFFWSPDGGRIAYFAPHLVSLGQGEDAGQAIALTLKFVDVKRSAVREAGTFFPTPAFLTMIQSFDQYAQALRIWSPDSRNVVYAAVDQEGPGIMVALAAESIEPRRVSPGLAAAWSRR